MKTLAISLVTLTLSSCAIVNHTDNWIKGKKPQTSKKLTSKNKKLLEHAKGITSQFCGLSQMHFIQSGVMVTDEMLAKPKTDCVTSTFASLMYYTEIQKQDIELLDDYTLTINKIRKRIINVVFSDLSLKILKNPKLMMAANNINENRAQKKKKITESAMERTYGATEKLYIEKIKNLKFSSSELKECKMYNKALYFDKNFFMMNGMKNMAQNTNLTEKATCNFISYLDKQERKLLSEHINDKVLTDTIKGLYQTTYNTHQEVMKQYMTSSKKLEEYKELSI